MNREVLEAGGIDVQGALDRMMGNEKLLARLLGKFLDDQSFAHLEAAFAAQDAEAALNAAHTLKGVAGNLSVTTVYELAGRQCDLLRAGSPDEAAALMPQLSEAYRAAQDAIHAGV